MTTQFPTGISARERRTNSRIRRRTRFRTTAPPTRREVMIPTRAGVESDVRYSPTRRRRPCADLPRSRTFANSGPERSRADFPKVSLGRSGSGVACVMDLDTLRQETFASPLAAAAQGCTSGFRRHAGAKTKLPLARPLRRLIGAFHKIGSVGREKIGSRSAESIRFSRKI